MASVDLVFPPLTGANYPYLSTAALLAYVRKESKHVARQTDLNLRVVNWLLQPDTLASQIKTAEAFLQACEGRSLNGCEAYQYARCAEWVLRAPALVDAIDAALAAVRSRQSIFQPEEIQLADTLIQDALAAATLDRPPELFGLNESVFLHAPTSPEQLRQALEDPQAPFLAIYDALIGEDEYRADVVGISIVYYSQVLPGLLFAAWLKRRTPRCKILVGGPIFTVHRERLAHHAWLFQFVDAFCIFEGEKTLVAYLDGCDAGRPAETVQGLVCLHHGQVVHTGMAQPVDVNALPCPSFDGLALDQYHMPEPVLPVLASRGCYWHCAFCTHHYIYGESYRVRSRERVLDDLAELRQRYGCQHVYFVDESMSPSLLRHIASALLVSGLDMRWGCELRTERALTGEDLQLAFRSGCRVFSFGVESASQRVLARMHKGIAVDEIERILNQAFACGIHNHMMCIMGFPGETAAEAQETIDFVQQHSPVLDLLGFSFFVLLRHSPVQLAPLDYGVTGVDALAPGLDFEERLAYQVASGLSRQESFAWWLRAIASPGSHAIRARTGHVQRERFLFSQGTQWLRGLDRKRATTPLRDRLAGLPRQLRQFSFPLDQARALADSFLLEAGRAYNDHGQTVADSWRDLAAKASLAPLQLPQYQLFRPERWTDTRLDGLAVSLLMQLESGASEQLAIDHHAPALRASAHDMLRELRRAGLLAIKQGEQSHACT